MGRHSNLRTKPAPANPWRTEHRRSSLSFGARLLTLVIGATVMIPVGFGVVWTTQHRTVPMSITTPTFATVAPAPPWETTWPSGALILPPQEDPPQILVVSVGPESPTPVPPVRATKNPRRHVAPKPSVLTRSASPAPAASPSVAQTDMQRLYLTMLHASPPPHDHRERRHR